MKRRFNITGLCVPDRHYMVDISSRLEEIRKLVEEGARWQKCRRRIFIKLPRGIEIAGRRLFLLYLRPIINGVGNYYVEAQTRDLRRTDVIVDYGGEQYIIEMKIWHGNEYNSRGERQLVQYLDDYHMTKGYMLSFHFNKNKTTGVREIVIDEKILIEAVV